MAATAQREPATPHAVSSNENKIESRYGKLVFTWRFGNTGMKGAKNRKTGIEDEKNRMGGN